MMRFKNWFGYPLILGAALAIGPQTLNAQGGPEKSAASPPATAKDLQKLDKTLQKMGTDIARDINAIRQDFDLHIKKTQDAIDNLNAKVKQLEKDLDSLRKGQPSVSNYGPNGKDIDEVRKQLDQLQQTLNAIRNQLPQTSTSLRPGTAGTSRIQLVNDYPFANEFVVNGARYVLQPGETRELKLSPGAFFYRVPTIGIADQDRMLAANETYTIRVYPR